MLEKEGEPWEQSREVIKETGTSEIHENAETAVRQTAGIGKRKGWSKATPERKTEAAIRRVIRGAVDEIEAAAQEKIYQYHKKHGVSLEGTRRERAS